MKRTRYLIENNSSWPVNKVFSCLTPLSSKIMATFLFLSLAFVSQLVQGAVSGSEPKRIFLIKEGIFLQDALREVEKQTEYRFFYDHHQVNTKTRVSVNLNKVTIDEALAQLFQHTNIGYRINGRQILLSPQIKAKETSSVTTPREMQLIPAAAEFTVKGTVKTSTNEILPGVSIVLKGTSRGTTTNSEGQFELAIPSGTGTLVFSYIGYSTQEVEVGSRSELNVVMAENKQSLEEIVVIGFGTQKKVDVTGSISTISAEKVNQGFNQSVSHALQGRASGVTVIQNSGEPGSGVEIRIRGAGSINDNSPLYVVDGIISSIGGLNPADIESISILKDAASAAIYGSRGANGVVIVTTKKGKRDQKTTVSYNTSQGLQQAWKMPESLTAAERNTIHTEALRNDGTPTSETIWDYYTNPDNAVTRTDWFKEVFRPAYISTHDLAIRGGSGKSNYSFSLGYLDNNGIVMNTSNQRYNVRFNSQHEIAKNLTFGENISMVISKQKAADLRGAYNGVLSSALFNMRNTPVWEDKANQIYGSPSGDFPNPVASLNSRDNVNKGTTIGGNAYLEYKFLNMFTIKSDLAYNWGFGKNKNFTAIALGGGRGLTENSLSETYITNSSWIWNNVLSVDKTIGEHHIAGLIGMSAEEGITERTETGTAKNFSNQDPVLRYFNNAGTFPNHPTGSAEDYSLQGYFARVSYEFADKYLLAANIRRDGSSKFAPDKRWGVFPSVSGGWRISGEKFFDPLKKVVSDLKIRASWGQLGNDKIPNYQFYSTVSTVGSPTLNGSAFTAVAQNRMANTTIQWEKTTQTDIGIDLELMNSRLLFTADYYDKKTTDILVRVPLVSSYGVGEAPYRNAGEVSNKGYEFSLTYRSEPGSKLGYEITGNVAHVKNKLVTLGVSGAKEIFTSDYKNTQVGRIAEGEPIGHFYVLNALGIFQSQSEVNNYKNGEGNLIQPLAVAGDVKFQDVNGDGVISAKDRINAGNSFPLLTYSLNVAANYGGFDLSMLWSGSQGNKIFNGLKLGGTFMQGSTYNNSPEILDRWTPESPSNSVPRVTIKDLNSNKTYSTLYVEDGSFFRMKYLTLGYTFGGKLKKTGISKLRVFTTFQNLITLTKYTGFDPEIGADVDNSSNMYGVDRGTYPQAKAYILGLNFNF
ncbi:TonB-dependent receptor P3 [Dyadobacter sp. CECT 9275]|uniref:TonB-dependent receptor P3 n=1 Tax=Dyadobacter helix TaxID=2822344 RepID=A0A916N490_9BACT|nr:TonB-dependent receptor [Dyadobacter sp. CECT 9275]CAG4999472.1 TonB-dependent receptor P3 [Dyadobacter sp. CECT 9275]